MTSRNNFISGITDLLVLSFLKKQDRYVYEITKEVQKSSGGLLSISQNTIYTATYKLEDEGYISEYSKLVGKKRTRVYYRIEPKGLEYLEQLAFDYQLTTTGVQNILNLLDPKQGD